VRADSGVGRQSARRASAGPVGSTDVSEYEDESEQERRDDEDHEARNHRVLVVPGELRGQRGMERVPDGRHETSIGPSDGVLNQKVGDMRGPPGPMVRSTATGPVKAKPLGRPAVGFDRPCIGGSMARDSHFVGRFVCGRWPLRSCVSSDAQKLFLDASGAQS
jgi:hypothetical protein